METHHQKSNKLIKQRVKLFLVALLIVPIRGYQWFISPWLGQHCRFQPSCSHYAIEALREHGPFMGLWLAVRRLSKCHPWHKGGCDPVPLKSTSQHKDGL